MTTVMPEPTGPDRGDGPDRSPDLLVAPPKRGVGVKRLNRKPLMFVMGGASVVALVLIFTLNAKAQRPDADPAAVSQAKPSDDRPSSARPDFLGDAQTTGTISADAGGEYAPGVPVLVAGPEAGGAIHSGPGYPNQNAVAGGGYQQAAYSGGGGGQAWNPHADAWQAHNQMRASMIADRYKAADDARLGGSAVQIPTRQGNANGATGQTGGAQGGGMQMNGPAGGNARQVRQSGDDPNQQGDKRTFAAESGGRSPYASGRVQSQVSPNEVKAGTVIPATLITGLNSDLPGQLVAQVNRNVYDTATGRRLLIPQGARLVGEYNSGVTYGQSRAQIAWTRLIYPDGSSIDLGSMPGTDAGGYTGVRDRVNNHTLRRWGNAAMLGIFAAGVQISQPQAANGENVSSSQTAAAQLGQQLGQLGMEQARKDMGIQPSITIRPGMLVTAFLTQDLILREWRR